MGLVIMLSECFTLLCGAILFAIAPYLLLSIFKITVFIKLPIHLKMECVVGWGEVRTPTIMRV